jgi:pantoate--beta-alanine ligase
MKIVHSIAEMKGIRAGMIGSVGFVPTMGFLHDGHISLVALSKRDNSINVVSIFINPTQFGPKEDFNNYPRDEKRDISLLEKAGTDIVFIPSAQEMYPAGFATWVEVKNVTEQLEGAVRPGHFRGVATVCNKLFNIVQPDKAYFGQKDVQQVLVIKKMVAELNMNLEIVVGPTLREADGLAMSSRNAYLKPDERKAAPVLYRALSMAQEMWLSGESNAEIVKAAMNAVLATEPLANVNYVSVADSATLIELGKITPPALVSLAVRIGKTRLIDNIVLI